MASCFTTKTQGCRHKKFQSRTFHRDINKITVAPTWLTSRTIFQVQACHSHFTPEASPRSAVVLSDRSRVHHPKSPRLSSLSNSSRLVLVELASQTLLHAGSDKDHPAAHTRVCLVPMASTSSNTTRKNLPKTKISCNNNTTRSHLSSAGCLMMRSALIALCLREIRPAPAAPISCLLGARLITCALAQAA